MKFYVNPEGAYLGGTDGDPLSEIEVPAPPDHALQTWDGQQWTEPEDYQVELDEDWLRSKITPIRIIRLFHSITNVIPPQSRDATINQFRDWVQNVRQRRQE